MKVEGFYAHQKLSCGGSVERNYYNPYVGTKGGKIATKTVCSICYLDGNIVDKVEILTRLDILRKHLWPLFRNCFDMNIKFPDTR